MANREMNVDVEFTKRLRKETRDVHNISNIIVNAKFVLALSSDKVWADGLLAFYEIYKYLEENLPHELLPPEFHRTKNFEDDLTFFLGEDWKDNYEPRTSVKKYLDHLEKVNKKSSILLFAFAYQMYMALVFGGQLLQKKRMIARKLWIGKDVDTEVESTLQSDSDDLETRPAPTQVATCPPGCAATYFTEKISDLKAKLRHILSIQSAKFDEKMRLEFIEESRNVFIYNSDVLRSIRGVNGVTFKNVILVLASLATIYLALRLAKASIFKVFTS